MLEEPNKAVDNRRPNGTFGPGNNANPAGRPKGSSMKEYWQRKFYAMTDEEKERWCIENKISPDKIWTMAEGSPRQDTTVVLSEDEPSAIKLGE